MKPVAKFQKGGKKGAKPKTGIETGKITKKHAAGAKIKKAGKPKSHQRKEIKQINNLENVAQNVVDSTNNEKPKKNRNRKNRKDRTNISKFPGVEKMENAEAKPKVKTEIKSETKTELVAGEKPKKRVRRGRVTKRKRGLQQKKDMEEIVKSVADIEDGIKEGNKNKNASKKSKRYTLFVGNVPFDATVEQIEEYFKKTCNVTSVRIPLEKETDKPRGFVYVEVKDHESFEKGLSLHHTIFQKRRINVTYSQNPNQTVSESKAKNLKLQALRQKGMLIGSKKDTNKRSFRREKKRQLEMKTEA